MKKLKSIFFVQIILIIFIVIIEFSSHIFLKIIIMMKHNTNLEQITYYEFSPYVLWQSKDLISGFDKYSQYEMNNYGFRNIYNIAKTKKHSIYRIIVLGGSVAWGTGATNNLTVWTNILESKLNHQKKTNHEIQVLNAGCAGYISFQEFILLNQKIINFNPDLVLFLNGWNDIVQSSFYDMNSYQNNIFPYAEEITNWHNSGFINQIIQLVLSKSHFIKLITRIIDYTKYHHGKHIIAHNHTLGVNNYIHNMKLVHGVLTELNIPYRIIIQPFIGVSQKMKSNDELEIQNKISINIKTFSHLLQDLENKMLKNNTLKANTYSTLDIFDKMNESSTVWYDHCHLNDLGQEVLANYIYLKLLEDKNLKLDNY